MKQFNYLSFAIVAITILCLNTIYAQTSNPKVIHPKITENTLFIGLENQILEIDPVISDGLIRIRLASDTLLFLDLKGKCVFGKESKLKTGNYNDPTRGKFSGSVAMVKKENLENVIICSGGQYLEVPKNHKVVSGFTNGVAMTEQEISWGNYKSCFLNSEGKEIYHKLFVDYGRIPMYIPPGVGKMSDGLFAYYDPNLKKWGYADTKGEIIVKPQFEKAMPFYDGLAAVAIMTPEDKYYPRWGFANKKGEMQIAAQYKYCPSNFSEGFAIARLDYEKFCYIDKTGKTLSTTYTKCNNFKDGFAFVSINGKTNLIDNKFNIIKIIDDIHISIPVSETDFGFEFYAGLKAINSNDKSAMINSKGEIVMSFEKAEYGNMFYDFFDGEHALIDYPIGGMEGYDRRKYSGFMNKKGEIVALFFMYQTNSYSDTYKVNSEKILKDFPQFTATTLPKTKIKKDALPTIGSCVSPGKKYQLSFVCDPIEAGKFTKADIGYFVHNTFVGATVEDLNPKQYRYEGWFDENDKEIIKYKQVHHFHMPAKDTKITAKYTKKYHLSFDVFPPDAGIITKADTGYFNTDETIGFFTKNINVGATVKDLKPEQYTFIGWFDETEKEILKELRIVNFDMPAKNTKITARYKEKLKQGPDGPDGPEKPEKPEEPQVLNEPKEKYDVCFNVYPDSAGILIKNDCGKFIPLTDNVSASVKDLNPKKYKFVGWFNEGVKIEAKREINIKMPAKNTKITAKYEKINEEVPSLKGQDCTDAWEGNIDFKTNYLTQISGRRTDLPPFDTKGKIYIEMSYDTCSSSWPLGWALVDNKESEMVELHYSGKIITKSNRNVDEEVEDIKIYTNSSGRQKQKYYFVDMDIPGVFTLNLEKNALNDLEGNQRHGLKGYLPYYQPSIIIKMTDKYIYFIGGGLMDEQFEYLDPKTSDVGTYNNIFAVNAIPTVKINRISYEKIYSNGGDKPSLELGDWQVYIEKAYTTSVNHKEDFDFSKIGFSIGLVTDGNVQHISTDKEVRTISETIPVGWHPSGSFPIDGKMVINPVISDRYKGIILSPTTPKLVNHIHNIEEIKNLIDREKRDKFYIMSDIAGKLIYTFHLKALKAVQEYE